MQAATLKTKKTKNKIDVNVLRRGASDFQFIV